MKNTEKIFKLPENLKLKYLKKQQTSLTEDDLISFLSHLSEPLPANMTLKAAKIAYYDMLKDFQ